MKVTEIEVVLFDAGDSLAHIGGRWKEVLLRYNPRRICVPGNRLVALRLAVGSECEGSAVVGTGGKAMPADGERIRGLLAPLLLGRDPLYHESLWMEMYAAGLPRGVLSLADLALWDLVGKRAGLPAWKLVGGCRDRVKVYIASHTDFGTPEDYAEHALACKRRGYHGYKVHGCFGRDPVRDEQAALRAKAFPEYDVAICEAIRDAVGEEWSLMLDPAHMYDYEQSLWVAHQLEELGFRWLESPMPENDEWVDRYARLCAETEIPICAPETADGAHFARARWIKRDASDISRIDPYYGGFTACIKTAFLCQAHGMTFELHSTATDAHNLQVLGATGEELSVFLEDYDLEPESGEAYVGANFVTQRADGSRGYPWVRGQMPIIDGEGYAHVPEEPGIGLDPDWEYIRRNRLTGGTR